MNELAIQAVIDFHNETHSGVFDMCYEAPCYGVTHSSALVPARPFRSERHIDLNNLARLQPRLTR